MISPPTEIERLVWYTLFSNLVLSAYIETGEEMDAGNGLKNTPVVEPTLPLEALLSESKRLQAISWQLIRESREQRTIYMLLEHVYSNHHIHLEKYPHLIVTIILER